MPTCRQCGAEHYSETARFCTKCGAAYSPSRKEVKQSTPAKPFFGFRGFIRSLFGSDTASGYLSTASVSRHYWRGFTARGKFRAPASKDKIATFHKQHRLPDVSHLSPAARKVFIYLFHIADVNGYCWPFYRTIAKRTGFSESTVGKSLKELEIEGLISHHQRVSRRGRSSNLYRVNVSRNS